MSNSRFHPSIDICQDAGAISEVARQKIIDILNKNSQITIALSGGSTPKKLYHDLCENLPIIREKVIFLLGDERLYPVENEQTNYQMAFRELLHKLPSDHLIPVDPTAAIATSECEVEGIAGALAVAEDYEAKLHKRIPLMKWAKDGREIMTPVIDIVLLGFGSDGHTASIFPESVASKETERTVSVAFPSPSMKPKVWRVSITPHVIQNARHVLVLATGKDKSWVIKGILNDECPSGAPVSRFLRDCKGDVSFVLDREAAADIQP
ncbi:unnamed protein product [Phytomonas sp. EM1]|nr:unnamed protein product [Phytomonas sp. EM1]|eukprot:CCW59775.1 unnamed protein product [Phytomonas sp. isolate EM1]